MLTIVAIMLGGMCLGFLFRKQNLKWIQPVITFLIWVLLFLLGIEVGGNERIVSSLQTLGWEAVILSLGGIAGSILLSYLLWRNVCNKQKEKEQ